MEGAERELRSGLLYSTVPKFSTFPDCSGRIAVDRQRPRVGRQNIGGICMSWAGVRLLVYLGLMTACCSQVGVIINYKSNLMG
jgi:hypothetical protein